MLTVGQKLWYVPYYNYGGEAREVVIEKVGRKWAIIGPRERIDVNTLEADGGGYSSPGRCYFSREEHQQLLLLRAAWARFEQTIRYNSIPAGVTVEHIKEAARILKISLDIPSMAEAERK